MNEEKPESSNFRVIIYHFSRIRDFPTLEEAIEKDVSISRFSPETISFVGGRKPELDELRVCKAMLVHSNYAIVHYQPLGALEEWLLQHRNEVLKLYFGQGEDNKR